MLSTRSGATKLTLAVISGLVALKIAVGAVTGSLSIIAQAVDSFLDLFAVIITFFAIRIADRPADGDHHFGHGKVENVAAIAQAALIFVVGVVIIYAAIQRIISGTSLQLTEAGIAVMLVSIIASIFLSRYLLRVARETDSPALEANAHNIAADVYSALAVLAGLTVIRFTGIAIIDPVLAILAALYIFKVAYDVLRRSFNVLIDVKLPESEEQIIHDCLLVHRQEIVDFHRLRTRKSGGQRHIDLHIVTNKYASVAEAHRLCDRLEYEISGRLEQSNVTIHVEPCDENCELCPISNSCQRPG